MRALEFIRDHVTFKLPYDFSYQMKTPYIYNEKNIPLFIDFSYFNFFRKSQKNSLEKEVNQNHQWLHILILFSLWFHWFQIFKSTIRIVLLTNSDKILKKCWQDLIILWVEIKSMDPNFDNDFWEKFTQTFIKETMLLFSWKLTSFASPKNIVATYVFQSVFFNAQNVLGPLLSLQTYFFIHQDIFWKIRKFWI